MACTGTALEASQGTQRSIWTSIQVLFHTIFFGGGREGGLSLKVIILLYIQNTSIVLILQWFKNASTPQWWKRANNKQMSLSPKKKKGARSRSLFDSRCLDLGRDVILPDHFHYEPAASPPPDAVHALTSPHLWCGEQTMQRYSDALLWHMPIQHSYTKWSWVNALPPPTCGTSNCNVEKKGLYISLHCGDCVAGFFWWCIQPCSNEAESTSQVFNMWSRNEVWTNTELVHSYLRDREVIKQCLRLHHLLLFHHSDQNTPHSNHLTTHAVTT